ncbi:MAG: helix-turn-helix transcriptional regulator [Solirubrobacteraceae bacterium]
MTVLIDCALIARRRLQRGLSQRELAHRLGFSAATVRRLETVAAQPELSLRELSALAGELGAAPAQLLASGAGEDDTAARQEPSGLQGDADAAVITAALASLDRPASRAEIAAGLGWPLGRVEAALHAAARRLHGSGLDILIRPSGDVCLIPAPGLVSRDQERELARARLARRGLRSSEARLLLMIARGERLPLRLPRNDRVALGALINAGLVQNDGTRLCLSEAAAHALRLDQRPRSS